MLFSCTSVPFIPCYRVPYRTVSCCPVSCWPSTVDACTEGNWRKVTSGRGLACRTATAAAGRGRLGRHFGRSRPRGFQRIDDKADSQDSSRQLRVSCALPKRGSGITTRQLPDTCTTKFAGHFRTCGLPTTASAQMHHRLAVDALSGQQV